MSSHPQLPRRSAEEQARLESHLQDLFEHRICFHEVVGFKVASLVPESTALSFEMRPELIGNFL